MSQDRSVTFRFGLALAALTAMLAGCGSSGNDAASPNASEKTQPSASSTTTTASTAKTTTTKPAAGSGVSCEIDYGTMDWAGTDTELLASNEKAQADCDKLFDKFPGAAFGGFGLPALIGEDLKATGDESRAAELRRLHREGFTTLTITVHGKGCDDPKDGGSIDYVVSSDPKLASPFTEARLRAGLASLQEGATFDPIDGGVIATFPPKADDTTCPVAWGVHGNRGTMVVAPTNAAAAATAQDRLS